MTPEEEATLRAQVAQLRQQQAFQTEALRALVEGRYQGEQSAAAFILALNPQLQVNPLPNPSRPA